jgi:hypothetical protein
MYGEAAPGIYISIHPGTYKEPCAYGYVLSKNIIDYTEDNSFKLIKGSKITLTNN